MYHYICILAGWTVEHRTNSADVNIPPHCASTVYILYVIHPGLFTVYTLRGQKTASFNTVTCQSVPKPQRAVLHGKC